MIKNKLKLSLAAAMIATTCSYAGTVTAPNVDNIEISGELILKQARDRSTTPAGISEVESYRTAEVTLNIDATVADTVEIHTAFTAYDDTQAENGADQNVRIDQAYAVVPILNGKGKVVAGLAPNNQYGTEAFDNGGESWKLAVNMPVAKGVKVTVVSKIENEEKQNGNKGDSGTTAIRVDAKVGEFKVGAKYGHGYKNKNDGFTGTANTEIKAKVFMAYATGTVSDIDLGFEYANKSIQKIGALDSQQPKDNQVGYFATAQKEMGQFRAGVGYMILKHNMQGGGDFAPGMILDGNVNSTGDAKTEAIVIPVSYAVNDALTTSVTYIDAEIGNDDVTEYDFGVEYTYNDNIGLSATYGQYNGEQDTEDQKNFEIEVAITF